MPLGVIYLCFYLVYQGDTTIRRLTDYLLTCSAVESARGAYERAQISDFDLRPNSQLESLSKRLTACSHALTLFRSLPARVQPRVNRLDSRPALRSRACRASRRPRALDAPRLSPTRSRERAPSPFAHSALCVS